MTNEKPAITIRPADAGDIEPCALHSEAGAFRVGDNWEGPPGLRHVEQGIDVGMNP